MSDNERGSLRADNGAVIINGSVVHGSIIQTINVGGSPAGPPREGLVLGDLLIPDPDPSPLAVHGWAIRRLLWIGLLFAVAGLNAISVPLPVIAVLVALGWGGSVAAVPSGVAWRPLRGHDDLVDARELMGKVADAYGAQHVELRAAYERTRRRLWAIADPSATPGQIEHARKGVLADADAVEQIDNAISRRGSRTGQDDDLGDLLAALQAADRELAP